MHKMRTNRSDFVVLPLAGHRMELRVQLRPVLVKEQKPVQVRLETTSTVCLHRYRWWWMHSCQMLKESNAQMFKFHSPMLKCYCTAQNSQRCQMFNACQMLNFTIHKLTPHRGQVKKCTNAHMLKCSNANASNPHSTTVKWMQKWNMPHTADIKLNSSKMHNCQSESVMYVCMYCSAWEGNSGKVLFVFCYFVCANSQMHNCSHKQMLKCTNGQMHKWQMLKCPNGQMANAQTANGQMHKCSNAQMLKYQMHKWQMLKCTNAQCTNAQMLKPIESPIHFTSLASPLPYPSLNQPMDSSSRLLLLLL